MLLLNDFRDYITNIKDSIEEIERENVVMDDSQLNKFLGEIPEDNKYIVLGIIPKHNPIGSVDTIQSVDKASILILKKVTRSDQTHTNFLDTFAEAQAVTKKVILKMRADKANDEALCNVMKFLNIDSIDVNPIWALAGCDGYEIDFTTKTNF